MSLLIRCPAMLWRGARPRPAGHQSRDRASLSSNPLLCPVETTAMGDGAGHGTPPRTPHLVATTTVLLSLGKGLRVKLAKCVDFVITATL